VDAKTPLVLTSAEGSVSANIERLMREQVLFIFFFFEDSFCVGQSRRFDECSGGKESVGIKSQIRFSEKNE
jgi:hypothetical protein